MATTTACVNPADRDDLIAQRLNRCQLILPLITAAGSLLGAIFGGLYTVHNTRLSQEDQQRTEWRSALNQVKFGEDDLVVSSYLLASYEKTDFGDDARNLQILVLQHATKAATFDQIFDKMLSDAASTNDKHPDKVATDLLAVDRSLSERLQTQWTKASHNPPVGQSNPTYDEFVKNPASFYSESQQAELNKTLVLIWQLDSFSKGMNCIWNSSTTSDCPHLSKPIPEAQGMVLLNYGAPNFKTMESCHVQQSGEDQYKCE